MKQVGKSKVQDTTNSSQCHGLDCLAIITRFVDMKQEWRLGEYRLGEPYTPAFCMFCANI